MNRIERVVVDECVGQESPLVGQLCERLGERPVKFVFLATEHPGIPDIEILDKLLDVRSALLTQELQPWGTRNYQRPSLARRGAFGGEGLSAKLTGATAGKPDGPAHRILPGRRSRARGRRAGRGPGGGAARPRQVRGDLPAAGAEEAHEGPSGARLPRAVPRSRNPLC